MPRSKLKLDDSGLTREEIIQRQLGEIIGELRAVSDQNTRQQETLNTINSTIVSVSSDVAAIKATQTHQGANLDGLTAHIEKLEARVGRQEVIAAKHGAFYGGMAAAGMAILIEAIKGWFFK